MAKQYHSRSYHRYFENYAEKEVLKPGGGYEIQRVYVGNYYKADLTDSENRRSKLTILILYLLTLTGYFALAGFCRQSVPQPASPLPPCRP